MFGTVLIANRGEIACRIIRTCRRLGIKTVAVHSEADTGARHVRLADEACCVGPAPSADSYLRIDRIVEAALQSGAQAIHPGYGFLSENADFAEACATARLVFVGPPAGAIRAMGSKSAAKALMQRAGVPVVPGYHGDDQSPSLLRSRAEEIGYPVLIKATAGGGGKGMRLVERDADFESALASCRREAQASFGDERVLIEKYLVRPRHIEIQVFGDSHGDIVSLFERDCSVQRRHQKVVEEAPAPGLTPEQREAMSHAAREAARAVGYVGAGTVEFIVDRSGEFHFMEMNTRLQVEHPVTEMITGLDLVEWQLRVAAGEPLPLRQADVSLRGHAIEARIYAEQPEQDFLPSIGRLVLFEPPTESMHVRVDSGVDQGDEVGAHYDPMLAKLIVWDETRKRAVNGMLAALASFRIAGVGNNRRFLARLIDHPEFRGGQVDTRLIDRASAVLLAPSAEPAPAFETAALWTLHQEAQRARRVAEAGADRWSPWSIADGWRLSGCLARRLTLHCGEQDRTFEVKYTREGWSLDGLPAVVECDDHGHLSAHIGERQHTARVVHVGERLHVFLDGEDALLTVADPLAHAGEDAQGEGSLTAPMPGRILELPAAPGAIVDKGAPLVIMEAMKMEHTLRAPARGEVRAYRCTVGEQVQEGSELVEFEVATKVETGVAT